MYDGFIGCGGLFLANKMVEKMGLKNGDVVLDIGCGLGAASIYLAKQFDTTKTIAFANNYFDAIFSMNALFMFESDENFLSRLLCTLK